MMEGLTSEEVGTVLREVEIWLLRFYVDHVDSGRKLSGEAKLLAYKLRILQDHLS